MRLYRFVEDNFDHINQLVEDDCLADVADFVVRQDCEETIEEDEGLVEIAKDLLDVEGRFYRKLKETRLID